MYGRSTGLTPQRTGFEAGDGPMMDGVSQRIHTHPRYLCYIIRTYRVYSDGTGCGVGL